MRFCSLYNARAAVVCNPSTAKNRFGAVQINWQSDTAEMHLFERGNSRPEDSVLLLPGLETPLKCLSAGFTPLIAQDLQGNKPQAMQHSARTLLKKLYDTVQQGLVALQARPKTGKDSADPALIGNLQTRLQALASSLQPLTEDPRLPLSVQPSFCQQPEPDETAMNPKARLPRFNPPRFKEADCLTVTTTEGNPVAQIQIERHPQQHPSGLTVRFKLPGSGNTPTG